MIASGLEMRKVGWIVAHPPREKGFFLSGAEVITAAELQLEAADGVEETPFVTVMVSLNEENNVFVEGFQVCFENYKEGICPCECLWVCHYGV